MNFHQSQVTNIALLASILLCISCIYLACEESEPVGDASIIKECSRERRPIIFIHGFLAAGDTWNRQISRLQASGSCLEDIEVLDWNSLDMSADQSLQLDELVEKMLTNSDFAQVDLVGHSAGGGVAYNYLSQAEYSSKVHRYVHIASFPNEKPAGPDANIPTLNLWSSDDLVVEAADIPGAVNVELTGLDHYEIATSLESFFQITEFLYETSELRNDPFSTGSEELTSFIQVSGKVLSLGENQALKQENIELWKVDNTGTRLELIESLESSANGEFVVKDLEADQFYEWVPKLSDPNARKVRYYTPILKTTQPRLYLRTFPGEGSLASILVRQLPQNNEQSSLVIFNAHRAFLADKDQLSLDGTNILTQEVASAEDTAIALFIFDINEDGQMDGRIPLFDGFPFLSVVDYPISARENESLNINYNGLELNIPKHASQDATIVVIFP